MVPDAYVNHVPVMTGGVVMMNCASFIRRDLFHRCRRYNMTPVSRTIGVERVVDEMVFEFTHRSNGLDAARS